MTGEAGRDHGQAGAVLLAIEMDTVACLHACERVGLSNSRAADVGADVFNSISRTTWSFAFYLTATLFAWANLLGCDFVNQIVWLLFFFPS